MNGLFIYLLLLVSRFAFGWGNVTFRAFVRAYASFLFLLAVVIPLFPIRTRIDSLGHVGVARRAHSNVQGITRTTDS